MQNKTTVLSLVLSLFAGAAICFAADNPNMGTWKLNETKSKIGEGMPKNHTVVYEMSGDSVKVTVDGTDKEGKATHNEWTGKFDGKDYPVTGDPTADTRAYKKMGKRTLEFTGKKDGKMTYSGKIMVSADGKTRTVTTSGKGEDGKMMKSTAVYDKQ